MKQISYFDAQALREFVQAYFVRYGVPSEDARIAADVLVEADLRGVDSHGVIRMYSYYGSRLANGLVDPKTPLTTIRESPVSLALDAGAGLGQVAGYRAMQRCIEKAAVSGMAAVTVRNSNHYGIAGYYAMMALPHDMIGISLTNSQPLIAPSHSRVALLGTNPIAVAVPAKGERPYVLDMATSIVPIGRITVYQKAEKNVPAGWGIDPQGRVTEDPNQILNGGALLPLGGTDEMRGYKGYGLSLLVDLLSGLLSGAAFGCHVGQSSNSPANVGHFFAAMRIDLFRSAEEFKADMDQYLREIKSAPLAAGEDRILIHGEKEFEKRAANEKNGVPLMQPVVTMLQDAARDAGIPYSLSPLRVEELP